jgi:hypothetical protein
VKTIAHGHRLGPPTAGWILGDGTAFTNPHERKVADSYIGFIVTVAVNHCGSE